MKTTDKAEQLIIAKVTEREERLSKLQNAASKARGLAEAVRPYRRQSVALHRAYTALEAALGELD